MRRLLVALVAVVLVASCGDDDDRADTVQPADPPTTESVEIPATEPQTETREPLVSTTSPAATPDTERLEAALLTIDDLPTGWASWDADDEDDESSEECDAIELSDEAPPAAEVHASFSQGDFGPFLSEALASYDGDAVEAFATFAGIIDRCQSYTSVDEDGNESTTTFSPLSFPDLGDDTFAVRLSIDSEFFPVSGDLVVMRIDEILVYIANIGIGTVDSAFTEDVASIALDRLIEAMLR